MAAEKNDFRKPAPNPKESAWKIFLALQREHVISRERVVIARLILVSFDNIVTKYLKLSVTQKRAQTK